MTRRPLALNRPRPWYRRWATARRLTGGLFLTLLILASFEWFPWLAGNTSGTKTLGLVPLIDPLAAVELLAASHSITRTTVIGASLLVLVAVVVGPVFCGFFCPLGLVLDLNQSLRRLFLRVAMNRARRAPVPHAVPHGARYGLLGVLLGFALITGVPLFQALSPINLLVRGLVTGSAVSLTVVGGLMAIEWFLPRAWCRALCPLGACYSVLGRPAIWRVRINPETAGQIRCQQCQVRCPMGIPVMTGYTLVGRESVTHPSCIRCGDCIDVCPNTVLGLRARPFPGNDSPGPDRAHHLPVLGPDESPKCETCDPLAR